MALLAFQPKTIIILVFAVYCLLLSTAEGVILVDFEQCQAAVNASYSNDPSIDYLRDQNGKPTSNISTAWGISYQACKDLCTVGTSFVDWNDFSFQFSTWLLPWLALTAQLPFETKNRAKNFQSLYLAIGCPLLIIYSLTLTILNARAINREFRQIKEDAKNLQLEVREEQLKIVENVRIILIESQNVPLQIVNGPEREIAQLVVNPKNASWWSQVAQEILKTKRGWTYSLIAQLAMVIVAQGFSIIDYFTSTADDTTITVGLALNSLWIWMIPVTLGWVFVGTQTSAGSIKTAISSATVQELGDETNVTGRPIGLADRTRYGSFKRRGLGLSYFSGASKSYMDAHPKVQSCEGRSRRGDTSRNTEHSTGNYELQNLLVVPDLEAGLGFDTQSNSDRSNTRVGSQENNGADNPTPIANEEAQKSPRRTWIESHFPRLRDFDFAGDDLEPGPIFNYARVWSYMNVVAHIVEAFSCSLIHQSKHESVSRQPWDFLPSNYDVNLKGTPQEMSRYISKTYTDNENLLVHSIHFFGLKKNCVEAAFVAIILFWCTAGAGILIAYETPTVGLGCDSGGYLLYGLLATYSWILLLLSAYLSHLHATNAETGQPNTWWYIPLAALTCYTGKLIAGLNALWLLCASVFQFTNLYNTCWCSTSILSLHSQAWLVLFASDTQIASASRAPWIGGVFLAVFVSFASAAFFLGSRGDEIFEENKQ